MATQAYNVALQPLSTMCEAFITNRNAEKLQKIYPLTYIRSTDFFFSYKATILSDSDDRPHLNLNMTSVVD